MVAVAPAYAVECVQMWMCEMDDDATEEQIEAMAREWLKAAKKIEGGENLEAYVYFPIAVNATGETDAMFVVKAPSVEDWGKFWDHYGGSAAAEVEKQNLEKIVCPDSVVWESVKIK